MHNTSHARADTHNRYYTRLFYGFGIIFFQIYWNE